MRVLPLLALGLLACSKRDGDAPRNDAPKRVTYEAAYAVYDESGNTLLLCLDEAVTLAADAAPPEPMTREGSQRLPKGQKCASFGKRDLATCDAPKMGIRVHYYDVGVVTDDDSESRDCVAGGGTWKLDEREVARTRLSKNRKRLEKLVEDR